MPEPAFDILSCVERVRQGDEGAARELVRELYPLVRRIVGAHRPRRTSEEDLCQMTFIKVFAGLDRFSGKVPIEHWVSRIAVNTCLNQIQAEKIRPELRWADLSEEESEVLQRMTAATGDPHPADDASSREIVSLLLDTLAPKDRLVITLLHLEGRSLEEVKQLTGWNIAVVKVRAFRARQKLKKSLQQLIKSEML